MIDHRGDVIVREQKRRKILDDRDVCEIKVSEERYEAAVSSIVANNCGNPQEGEVILSSNPQDGNASFNRCDDAMQAAVADLTACLDEDLLNEAVSKRLAQSKIAMEAGSINVEAVPEDDGIFELSATQADTARGVTAEHLSRVWRVPLDDAKKTLEVTSQLSHQSTDASLSRRFGTNDRMLRYKRIDSLFYTDTFFSTKVVSKRGYSMMQLFVSDKGFVKVYGMKSVAEFVNALKLFCKEVGAPKAMVVDPHRSQKSNEVKQFLNTVGTTLMVLEESTQHANRAELYIGLMKRGVGRDMRESNSPMRLWCYACERRAAIMTMTANNLFQLQGQNPYMATLGEMADISNLCQFGWYEWVYFRQHTAKFPYQKEVLGRCLGPTKDEANEMAQWVLQHNGQIVPRRTLRRLRQEEMSLTNLVEKAKRDAFDAQIKELLGDSVEVPPEPVKEALDPMNNFDYDVEDELAADNVVPAADAVDAAGKPLNQQSVADLLINAEVLLDHDESQQMARVIRRSIGPDGKVLGQFDGSLRSLVYDVEFPDGIVKQYAANVIAENVLGQVDQSGYHTQSLAGIAQHKRLADAVSKSNGFITTKRGARKLRQTTTGWRFLCEWKDGSSSWASLKVLKESNPIAHLGGVHRKTWNEVHRRSSFTLLTCAPYQHVTEINIRNRSRATARPAPTAIHSMPIFHQSFLGGAPPTLLSYSHFRESV